VTPLLIGLAGVLGAAVGSFLNVVVHRVPAGLSVVRPASACPRCGSAIRRRDNVPVLSWLLLRGRCRDCGEPISVRYPLVEAATAALFAGVVVRFLVVEERPAAIPVWLYLAAIGVALALIDLEHKRLPNAIVLPSYVVVAVLLVLGSWLEGDWGSMLRALVGGVGLWLLYFLLMLVWAGGMGYGDVKLAGLLGGALAWLGWGTFATGAFGAFLVGGVVSVVLMAAGRARLKTGIPFGPWIVVGAFLAVAVGQQAWDAYLGLLL
jgi:leader peptidase (prepilin peptidase) / N-methyltransferase